MSTVSGWKPKRIGVLSSKAGLETASVFLLTSYSRGRRATARNLTQSKKKSSPCHGPRTATSETQRQKTAVPVGSASPHCPPPLPSLPVDPSPQQTASCGLSIASSEPTSGEHSRRTLATPQLARQPEAPCSESSFSFLRKHMHIRATGGPKLPHPHPTRPHFPHIVVSILQSVFV